VINFLIAAAIKHYSDLTNAQDAAGSTIFLLVQNVYKLNIMGFLSLHQRVFLIHYLQKLK